MRGTFANIRLRNLLGRGARAASRKFEGEEMPIYDAAMKYAEQGTPLVVLAGKEYGSGSSRDWAAKGTKLLGVRAVIAQSFERIHRSNLVGMGVVPLQFADGESVESLGLTATRRSRSPAWTAARPRRSRSRRATRSSPAACASTPPRRSSTSATAGSCRTCCAGCWRTRLPGFVAIPDVLRRLLDRAGPVRLRAGPGRGVPRGGGRLRRGHPRHRRLDRRARGGHRRRPVGRRRRPHRRDRPDRPPHRRRRLPVVHRRRRLGPDRSWSASGSRSRRATASSRAWSGSKPPHLLREEDRKKAPELRRCTSTSARATATRRARRCGSATSA